MTGCCRVDSQGYEVGGLVDVRYGDEIRFLEVGERYIVGVGASTPTTGVLVGTVRAPAPLFGGDDVVGARRQRRRLSHGRRPGAHPARSTARAVETGVLAPLRGDGKSLSGAVLRPGGRRVRSCCSALVLVKHLVFALGRALRDLGSRDAIAHPRTASRLAGRGSRPASRSPSRSAAERRLGAGAQVGDRVGEALGVAEQRAAGDQDVRAGGGRAGDGVGPDAAVDLDVDPSVEAGGGDHRPHLADLRLHRGDVVLAAEARG